MQAMHAHHHHNQMMSAGAGYARGGSQATPQSNMLSFPMVKNSQINSMQADNNNPNPGSNMRQ